jgi:hypothetical protein
LFIPDPDPDFLSIPDAVVKNAPDPDPGSWIRNTAFYTLPAYLPGRTTLYGNLSILTPCF